MSVVKSQLFIVLHLNNDVAEFKKQYPDAKLIAPVDAVQKRLQEDAALQFDGGMSSSFAARSISY